MSVASGGQLTIQGEDRSYSTMQVRVFRERILQWTESLLSSKNGTEWSCAFRWTQLFQTDNHPMISLPYDLIARVMEICYDQNQYDVIYSSSLVNWEFNRAASRMLYSSVVLDPPFKGPDVLDLRDVGTIPKSSNFDSACLPQNAAYVTSLKISGYLSKRPPPRNTLPQKVADALPAFINLSSIEVTPNAYHQSMVDGIVPMLSGLQRLTEMVVNGSCTDEGHADALVGVSGNGGGLDRLKKLTLVSPGRRILQLLPDWLGRLSETLVELHLKNNCGSVTPGVLKSFLPFVKDTLEGFTLGLSYSLTNQDVFDFLTQLTKLRKLELQYYWARISIQANPTEVHTDPNELEQQLKPPERLPGLTCLRAFTVTHPETYTRLEADRLDKWVRWVITRSRNLEVLCLTSDSDSPSIDIPRRWDPEPAYPSHNALVNHLTSKHWMKLKVLNLGFGSSLVRVDKLILVLEMCVHLEEVKIVVDQSALTMLSKRPATLPSLHTLSLRMANAPKSKRRRLLRKAEYEDRVLEVMKNHQPSLRMMWVDGSGWEARWKVLDLASEGHHEQSQSQLLIQRVVNAVPPWYRKPRISSS